VKKFTKRLRYGGMRFVRKFRHGQKGFTLMELLIVIGILGVLAAVLVPRLSTFLSSGQVAAANQEVAGVETAALAFYADNSYWPEDCNTTAGECLMDGPGGIQYLSSAPIAKYTFYEDGKVTPTDDTDPWPNDANVIWSVDDHKWVKGEAAAP
jgi:prepilin-type N-terminal cleavage/methylation domain-containing protein